MLGPDEDEEVEETEEEEEEGDDTPTLGETLTDLDTYLPSL